MYIKTNRSKPLNEVHETLYDVYKSLNTDMSWSEFEAIARLNIDIFGYFYIGDIIVHEVSV